MNVQMRIITEENIDQLSSMAFSDNIIRLTGKQDAKPADVVRNARGKMRPQATIMGETPQADAYALYHLKDPSVLFTDTPEVGAKMEVDTNEQERSNDMGLDIRYLTWKQGDIY